MRTDDIMIMGRRTLTQAFKQYFYATPADTRELQEETYRIRYQVYCKEFGYEREEDCPGGMERDSYDPQSRHALLYHRPSARPAGCVRLITPHPQMLYTPLPFERFCGDALDRSLIDPCKLPPGSYGEFSRLATLSLFRRRKEDVHLPINSVEPPEHQEMAGRDSFPLLPLGLFLTALTLFLNSRLQIVFAMMEPRLERLLRRYGILFTQVGQVMDYHGPRGPFMMHRDTLLPNLTPDACELMRLISKQLSHNAHDT